MKSEKRGSSQPTSTCENQPGANTTSRGPSPISWNATVAPPARANLVVGRATTTPVGTPSATTVRASRTTSLAGSWFSTAR